MKVMKDFKMYLCVSDENVQELAGELVELGLISEVGVKYRDSPKGVGVCVHANMNLMHAPSPIRA